ncbi:hypothetical protein BGW36DRAFT_80535 [Talaromyces proteolyticus]|uniref:Uncharacterized protein n=1 Tax=Talaromyces proteolyticus TaxID=1131652 RepID=A0AAD4KHY5_9EURO|nr:uncharacterized protein BGW36DRAFT_80535 [Talaromyces proteolyticus]KAH8688852.1 hypothetical protein BGW36DRAFT_80535 [Talaromyces proteolyticus]
MRKWNGMEWLLLMLCGCLGCQLDTTDDDADTGQARLVCLRAVTWRPAVVSIISAQNGWVLIYIVFFITHSFSYYLARELLDGFQRTIVWPRMESWGVVLMPAWREQLFGADTGYYHVQTEHRIKQDMDMHRHNHHADTTSTVDWNENTSLPA